MVKSNEATKNSLREIVDRVDNQLQQQTAELTSLMNRMRQDADCCAKRLE